MNTLNPTHDKISSSSKELSIDELITEFKEEGKIVYGTGRILSCLTGQQIDTIRQLCEIHNYITSDLRGEEVPPPTITTNFNNKLLKKIIEVEKAQGVSPYLDINHLSDYVMSIIVEDFADPQSDNYTLTARKFFLAFANLGLRKYLQTILKDSDYSSNTISLTERAKVKQEKEQKINKWDTLITTSASHPGMVKLIAMYSDSQFLISNFDSEKLLFMHFSLSEFFEEVGVTAPRWYLDLISRTVSQLYRTFHHEEPLKKHNTEQKATVNHYRHEDIPLIISAMITINELTKQKAKDPKHIYHEQSRQVSAKLDQWSCTDLAL